MRWLINKLNLYIDRKIKEALDEGFELVLKNIALEMYFIEAGKKHDSKTRYH